MPDVKLNIKDLADSTKMVGKLRLRLAEIGLKCSDDIWCSARQPTDAERRMIERLDDLSAELLDLFKL